jgi:hypothetical protein
VSRPRLLLLLGGLLIAAWFVALNLANARFGRADNGDFPRLAGPWITKPVGFAVAWPDPADPAWKRRFFNCWHRYWELQPAGQAPEPVPDLGTTRFLWVPGFALSRAFSTRPALDLAWLGVPFRLAGLLLLLGFYGLAVRHFGARFPALPFLVTLPLAVIAADPRTTTFFHSLYRESGTILFALLTVLGLAALPGRRFWGPAALATLGGMLFAGSATTHFFTAFLVAAALPAAFLRWEGRRAPGWLGVVLAMAALVAAGAQSERQTAPQLRRNAAFDSLFMGALLVSNRPLDHLASLGFPKEARTQIGEVAFTRESQELIREHPSLMSHRNTVRILLREPAIVPRLLWRGAAEVTGTAGSFWAVSDVACERKRPRLAGWTHLRARLLPGGGPVLALLATGTVLGFLGLKSADRRAFGVSLALLFASLCALGELAVTVLGDGFVEIARHLLTAGLCTDIVLALLLWRLALAWVRWREEPSTP